MFNHAMRAMNIDVLKMPLGAVTKAQIAKGYEVLVELNRELEKSKPSKNSIDTVTSQFYTLIPHSFGRAAPPALSTKIAVDQKFEMLNTLADIAQAQALQAGKEKGKAKAKELPENPIDVDYRKMGCTLTPLPRSDPAFKVIETYVKNTGRSAMQILDVWEVNRDGESDRFKQHAKIDNRKLLWHGTNVAVVAAILNSGLRIMPHSGGRVGRGIYLASENSKSAGYVCCAPGNIGMMFLAEAALGKEHHINRDDSSLREAPKGFDSIVAKGRTEPPPAADTTLKFGGKAVTVPQGKPEAQKEFQGSSFSQSEYLVYKESQVHLRYLLKMKMY